MSGVPFSDPRALLAAPRLLPAEYSRWLGVLFQAPIWSPESPFGRRVLWTDIPVARQAQRAIFDSPGIYVFGSGTEPLYLGSSTDSVFTRLRRRYIRGEYSQCQLAVDYEEALRIHGIDGLPSHIRAWYQKNYRKATVRLRHAAEFAKRGARTIWIAPIPVSHKHIVRDLERLLIPIANEWNLAHGYPNLLNTQHMP